MPSLCRKALLALLIIPLATLAVADEAAESGLRPFEYYRAILDRKPFGELAPPPAPAGPVNAADSQEAIEEKRKEDALAKQIDMVAVNRTPRGKIAVGFIDKNAKPPRNYYLNVGDTSGGFKVLSADFDEEIATIEKDGVSIALKLGKGVIPKEELQGDSAGPVAAPISGGQAAQAIQSGAVTPPAGQGTTFGRPSFPGIRRGGTAIRKPALPASDGAKQGGAGYREDVRKRLEQRRQEEAERAREEQRKINEEVERRTEAATEAAAKREREVNLKLIASGQEPVSEIELTPEEDAELVKAGVLDAPAPPQQAQ